MFGWFRRPAACASRLNRARMSAVSPWASCCALIVLIATVRSMKGSNPSYTTPIAPRPSSRRMTYLPSFAGTVSDTLLVLRVNLPHGLLHEALHHRVETDAALGALRHSHDRARLGTDLHFFLGVSLRDLLGRRRIHDLVAHADQPDAGRFPGLHGSGDRPGRSPASSAAQDAEQVAHRPAVEALLHLRDLLCLEDVELDDPLRGLELADLHRLARLVRIAEVVGERDLVHQWPEVAALQHTEIGLRKLELGIVGDVVRTEFLHEPRVVALDLARNHDQLRTSLRLVHVVDGLVG